MMDWQNTAEPRQDGADSLSAAILSGHQLTRDFGTERTICDGQVVVRPLRRAVGPEYSAAPVDHPHIEIAESLLRLWPAGFRSFTALINVFYPMADERHGTMARGSTCGSDETEPGALYATVFDPVGLAEAWVHELGHTKLRALGIQLTSAAGLIANNPGDVFVSPIRKDIGRPMTAVLHAQYSYTYVAALDLELIKIAAEPWSNYARDSLVVNIERITEGLAEVRRFVETDDDGAGFMSGYYSWADRVIGQAREIVG